MGALFWLTPTSSEMSIGSSDIAPAQFENLRSMLRPYQATELNESSIDNRLLREADLLSTGQGSAVETLAQETLNAVADATIFQGYPTLTLGKTTDMWAGYDDSLSPDGMIVRSLIRFDLANLSPNQNITKATLRLYLVSSWDFPNTNRTITTHRITADWSESSVTFNNAPGFQDTYGSKPVGEDDFTWHEFDVTNLVAAWYSGTYPNYGIMLRGSEISGSDSSWRAFSTREGSNMPQLVVEYSAPATTTDSYVYLPLVLKGSSASPPAPNCPQTGPWGGTTIQLGDISFQVSDTPSCQVESLKLNYRVYCTYGFLDREATFLTSQSITNNHFEIGSGSINPKVVGDFTSQTEASGTWSSAFSDPSLGFCLGSGTWTTYQLPVSDLTCLYALNWWREVSPPYSRLYSSFSPNCLMDTQVDVEHIIDGIGCQTGYKANVKRQGKPDFKMDVAYIPPAGSCGVTGATMTKTYAGGYQHQMQITQFCPSVGTLTGYKVDYNGQEVTVGTCP